MTTRDSAKELRLDVEGTLVKGLEDWVSVGVSEGCVVVRIGLGLLVVVGGARDRLTTSSRSVGERLAALSDFKGVNVGVWSSRLEKRGKMDVK